MVDIIRKLQRGEVTPAWRVNPRVSKALEAGVRKAMAVGSAVRYASARSLAADIDHSLAGEPVSAWHQPRLVRARSWDSLPPDRGHGHRRGCGGGRADGRLGRPGRAGAFRRPGRAFGAGGGVYASGLDHGAGGPER